MNYGFELYLSEVLTPSTGISRKVVLAYLPQEKFGFVQSTLDREAMVKFPECSVDSLDGIFDRGNARHYPARGDTAKFVLMDMLRLPVETGVANRELTAKLNKFLGLCGEQ